MPDAPVVTGLAAEIKTPATGATAPVVEKLTLDGKEFEVPPAVAAALKAAKDAASAAGTTEADLRAQLEAAKKAAPATPAKAAATGEDIETLLFTDPKRAAKMIVDTAVAQVRAEYGVEKAQIGFWNDFYKSNPDLADADLVVKAVMQREMGKLSPMSVEKAAEHLAEASKKELLRLGVTQKQGKGGGKAPVAEGGTEGHRKPSKDTDTSESSPQSGGLSAVLKERQEARRASREGKTAAAE